MRRTRSRSRASGPSESRSAVPGLPASRRAGHGGPRRTTRRGEEPPSARRSNAAAANRAAAAAAGSDTWTMSRSPLRQAQRRRSPSRSCRRSSRVSRRASAVARSQPAPWVFSSGSPPRRSAAPLGGRGGVEGVTSRGDPGAHTGRLARAPARVARAGRPAPQRIMPGQHPVRPGPRDRFRSAVRGSASLGPSSHVSPDRP